MDPSVQHCTDSPIKITIQPNEHMFPPKAEIVNGMDEDIRMEPVKLELEIYAADPVTGERGGLVYKQPISSFSGLIPSKPVYSQV